MSYSSKEFVYPLTVPPHLFIGKKPTAVLFREERVDVKTWRGVYAVILTRCNQNEVCHQRLMELRGRIAGKVRVFLADSPDGMRSPLRIDEDIYAETHYGSATLMHILIERILAPVGFDISGISVAIKT